ncbi:sensor histidine kinase [Frondihabitans australicus]|uniref:sensor histidine kinase n=1 Tax=Frondihabitans australicus TaxID=386892 RepID=UPI0014757705|nr:sensor histidine kinase [Frondihabitans australicus]
MTGNRWWHVLFAATMLVVAGIFAANAASGNDERLSFAALVAMSVAYVAFGRRGFESRPHAVAFLAVVVVALGVGTAGDPNMATTQCIALPLVWIQLSRTRDAIVGNVVAVTAVAIGMAAFFDFSSQGLVEAALIEGISLVGSLCLGLWISRVFELSDERRRLVEELRAAQGRVEALSREAGATSERERLARDLHDTIAQSLTGLVLLSQRASREIAGGDSPRASETLALIEETARDTLAETRSLVAAGAPVDLDAGLSAALERLASRFSRETGVPVAVESDVAPGAVSRDTEVVLLRVAQEALANVRKHARATTARIRLSGDDARATMEIVDDGCGFDASGATDGYGLAGMRARIELAAGSVSVDSGPGRGTRLTVSVPGVPAAPAPLGSTPVSSPASSLGAAS